MTKEKKTYNLNKCIPFLRNNNINKIYIISTNDQQYNYKNTKYSRCILLSFYSTLHNISVLEAEKKIDWSDTKFFHELCEQYKKFQIDDYVSINTGDAHQSSNRIIIPAPIFKPNAVCASFNNG